MVAVLVKKRKRLEKWQSDYVRAVKQVVKEHREAVLKDWERMKQAERDYEAMDPDYKSRWDEDKLLHCAVGVWMILNGSAEQKRAIKVWVENVQKVDKPAKAPEIPPTGSGEGVQAHA